MPEFRKDHSTTARNISDRNLATGSGTMSISATRYKGLSSFYLIIVLFFFLFLLLIIAEWFHSAFEDLKKLNRHLRSHVDFEIEKLNELVEKHLEKKSKLSRYIAHNQFISEAGTNLVDQLEKLVTMKKTPEQCRFGVAMSIAPRYFPNGTEFNYWRLFVDHLPPEFSFIVILSKLSTPVSHNRVHHWIRLREGVEPEFSHEKFLITPLRNTLKDPQDRLIWRSTLSLNFARVVRYVSEVCDHVVWLEDDAILPPTFYQLLNRVTPKHDFWTFRSLSATGIVGLLLNSKYVYSLCQYIVHNFEIAPVDWLLIYWGEIYAELHPELVQLPTVNIVGHKGAISSLGSMARPSYLPETLNLTQVTFYYISQKTTWNGSLQFCRDLGLDFANFENEFEFRYAISLIPNNEHNWIGIFRDTDGIWKKASTPPREIQYAPWGNGEPNNFGGNEGCGEFSTALEGWNDNNCSQSFSFFCEYRPLHSKKVHFHIVKEPMTWKQSQDICTSFGSNLASLLTEHEKKLVLHTVLDGFSSSDHHLVWLGSRKMHGNKDWTWIFHYDQLVKNSESIEGIHSIPSCLVIDKSGSLVSEPCEQMFYPLCEFRVTDVRYFLAKTARTWEEAVQRCKLVGAHVASVFSLEELDMVKSIVNKKTVWMGGFRQDEDWNWVFVRNLPVRGVKIEDHPSYFGYRCLSFNGELFEARKCKEEISVLCEHRFITPPDQLEESDI